MTWAEEAAPKRLNDIAGNPGAVDEMRKWPGKPALLIVGPPGSGKTTAAVALAADKGWELFEMNASDLRDRKTIEKVAGLASVSATFSGKTRAILFDEIDGLFRADHGGAGAVLTIIREAKCPVLLTANDEYATPLSSIRRECAVVKFRKVHYSTIRQVLERLCKAHGVECDPAVAERIAKSSDGDLKAAINDLHALAIGRKRLDDKDVFLFERDRSGNIFNAMQALFKASEYGPARESFESVDEDPDMFMKWVDENIPREYSEPQDLAAAFDALSRADFYAAGIMRRQQWQLMKFQLDMMTAGVSMAKEKPYHGFTAYQFPSFIRGLSASKARRAAKQSAAAKIGKHMHASPREVITEYWFYLSALAKKDPVGYAHKYGLEEKELEALGITPAAAKKAAPEATE